MNFGITDLAAKQVCSCKYLQNIRSESDILREEINSLVLEIFSSISVCLDYWTSRWGIM